MVKKANYFLAVENNKKFLESKLDGLSINISKVIKSMSIHFLVNFLC